MAIASDMMKVLVVLYEGFTEYEYQIPILAFHHFGIPFDTVGLETPVVTGMIGLKASLAKTLAEVDIEDYTALFLPGLDYSTREQVMQNDRLMVLLREFDQAKKLIAAVCGAPILLGKAGILKGRRFCSDVQTHPVFEQAIRVQESAVRDENVITGLGARIFHFTVLLIEALTDKEKAVEYQRWAGI
jgi:4-methyl-5(b-hydroxyethyl)-thiazole monophosphate biosynthesis